MQHGTVEINLPIMDEHVKLNSTLFYVGFFTSYVYMEMNIG